MSQCVLVDCTGVTNSANAPGTLFMNDRVLVGCANGSLLYQCTAPASYPAGITFDTGASKVAVAAGTFGSSTLANANALATIYGTDFIGGEILAGRMFCGTPCQSLVILKDDEATAVLSAFCENIQTIGSAVFFMPYGGTSGIFSSPNGLNWARIFVPAAGKFAYDLAYGAGLYVAPGNSVGGNGVVYTSPDTVNWTQRTAIAGFASTLWTIAYGAGVFVVGGDVNTVAWSADGITWNNLGTIGAGGSNIGTLRFLNGAFYALNSSTGKMFSSTDGKVWVLAHTFTSPYDIAYGNGIYVLTENAGNAWTSPDAITWTQHAFAGAPHLHGIAFGNGLFTLATNTKKVFTSPDGVTWTDSGRTAATGLGPVTYAGNGKFVAAEG